MTEPKIEAAWAELVMDALASDGPIRDSDVKDAVKRNRRHIEAEASRATLDAIEAGVRVLGDLTGNTWHRQDPVDGRLIEIVDRDAVLALIEKQREG